MSQDNTTVHGDSASRDEAVRRYWLATIEEDRAECAPPPPPAEDGR